ncbi:zinc finger protein 280D isoform X1 [Conger conger]|uniref:zinc finger protein 280D isoform X1 n=1 Tax=Conger conger TaxID=82655 RepID=UPI002A5A9EF1|nr:zinc finger protein 280D isoform X1 [Conger conger]XP_061101489.1 zinc finger protein 280D isoform X1 [Conger conger]
MSELFMECEEEELEPWQRRIPEINLVDDDDDDDDEPIFVGEIRSKVTPNTRRNPAPVAKAASQRQMVPVATRTVMPVSPVMRAGATTMTTSPQRPPPTAASAPPVSPCGSSGPIVPQLTVRATAQSVPKSLLIPVASQAGPLPTVAQTVSHVPVTHTLSAQSPQPIIINNQGYIVTSPQIANNSAFIASLGNQYPPGTSFTVLPAGQQLLPQVAPAKALPGVVHRPQVQLIQNNIVTLANVQSPAQSKQPAAQFSPTKLQLPIHVVPSAMQSKLVTPPTPLNSGVPCKQPSPLLQVMSNTGIGMSAVKRDSPPDMTSNATKRTKLDLGVANVSDCAQNGTPFRKKCPRCNIQFNLPDPMRNHMRYCCSHLIDSVFPTTSKLGKPAPPARLMDTERGKLIMLVTEFYYGRHEGDKAVQKDQKANITFKCNSCLKVLKNNIRFMNHMKHHLELEKQSNESWDSHTTCQHCFRQYSTPFQLQCHIESAHSPYESTTNCKICELAFETEQVLLEHMKDNHKPGEMPYVCQVCNYRSSFFSEVESHFRSVHENTKDLLCPFCLKVLRSGHIYMQHYMKHQKKGIHRCGKCRLNFLTYKEKTEHKTHFHRTFKKPKTLEGLPPGTKVTIRASLLGGSPTSAGTPSRSIVSIIPSSPTSKQPSKSHSGTAKSKSSSQNSSPGKARPFQSKKQERLNSKLQEKNNEALKNVRNHLGQQICVECYTKVTDFYSHYPMVLNCGACKYRTCCKKSFENHMIRFHSAVSRDRLRKMRKPRGSLRSITLVCLNCDFLADASGTNLMSKHLIDRPHHNCQVIIEKGISNEEKPKTGPRFETSAGDASDFTRVETDILSGDSDPSDANGKDKEDLPLDSRTKSYDESRAEPSEVKDSKAASKPESERAEVPEESQAHANDGGIPENEEKQRHKTSAKLPDPVERDTSPGEPSGTSSSEKEKEEPPSPEAKPLSRPTDHEMGQDKEEEEGSSPKDDVPFQDFLRKSHNGESVSSDVSEQGSVRLEPLTPSKVLEPLTPSKVLEHEATEILQKEPESNAGAPSDSTDDTDNSRPSTPNQSKDTT